MRPSSPVMTAKLSAIDAANRIFVVGRATTVQLAPASVERRMRPPTPTARPRLPRRATPCSWSPTGLVTGPQLMPASVLRMIVPKSPTATHVLESLHAPPFKASVVGLVCGGHVLECAGATSATGRGAASEAGAGLMGPPLSEGP